MKNTSLAWALVPIVGIVMLLSGIAIGQGRVHFGGVPASTANKDLPSSIDYSSVDDVYSVLKRDFDGDLSRDDILNGLKEGLAKSTDDPYTEYFNPEDAKEFTEGLSGSFEGIGAELGKQEEALVIVAPLAGYPAEKAGLKAKDAIIKINDETTLDLSVNEAVKRIRGPKDTSVKLLIGREGKQQFEVTITRTKIEIPSVEPSIENGIGYLKINQFGDDTVRLTREAAVDFKTKNVRGVVVDLRNNPGGYLDGAVDIASLWLDSSKKVVEERRGGKVLRSEYARGQAVLRGVPTVVLINEGSASASEIVAGALRDHGAAKLVGAKTYGKGSVQQVNQLSNGGALKVTIARWYTPKGSNIDKEGIKPDTPVEISDADFEAQRDPQKDKAFELLR